MARERPLNKLGDNEGQKIKEEFDRVEIKGNKMESS